MATTSYGTPMGMGTQPMGMGMATSGVRNMNLPMSSARPIEVDENTPNLEEIQGFPVAGTAADGTHFHQDPITGQMYRMSTDLHQRIPQILADRKVMSGGITNIDDIDNTNSQMDPKEYFKFSEKQSLEEPTLRVNGVPVTTDSNPTVSLNTKFGINSNYLNMNDSLFVFKLSDLYDKKFREISTNHLIYDLRSSTPYNKGYYKPINMINNLSTRNILFNLQIEKYIPINNFINKINFNQKTIDDINNYTPINRFYNR